MSSTDNVIVGRHYQTLSPIRMELKNGRVSSVVPAAITAAEAPTLPIIGPGLFDLQVNGFHGIWFSSDTLTVDDVETVIHAYLQHGITRCLPTLITNSFGAIEHGLATLEKARERSATVRNVVTGYHIEGPFISPVDGPRGAHPLAHIRPPDLAEFQRWQKVAGGQIRLVTLAPEVPGAIPFIRSVSQSCLVAIGHSAAGTQQIVEAIDAGARLGTHLGNGCAGMIPRHDNVFWPQLADDRLACSVIADGWHVPDAMLQCLVRCKSMERTIVTCDVSGFGGCMAGRYTSGHVSVDVLEDGRIVVAGQTQFLAGSGVTTGDCVAHLMNTCRVTLTDALQSASIRPARLVGITEPSLDAGRPAFLTIFRLDTRADGRIRFVPIRAICGETCSRAAG
ncbi:MAG: N-acetylglucosamine-6-phosphate deacetylase [Planctomycetota bacterium]